MNIRTCIIGFSAITLLSLAGAANAHGVRQANGYAYGYNDGHRVAHRQHYNARHYRKRARHGYRHNHRSRPTHYRRGADLYFDGFSVRLYDDGPRRHRH